MAGSPVWDACFFVYYLMLVIGNYSVMFRNCYKILCSAKRFAGQRGQ